MGCDIHVHVEYKFNRYVGRDADGNSKFEKQWVCGDYFKINPYYHEGEDDGEKPLSLVGFCDGRNYARFAVLADVRNYADTPCISEPRGLPHDVTAEVKNDSDEWDCDGHSHSFFTLKELIDYQNDIGPLKHRGMISPEAQRALDERGELPSAWCQWTTQSGWKVREWEEENTVLLPLIDALKKRADELYVIYDFEWEKNPEVAYKKSEDIRIVFWFDN